MAKGRGEAGPADPPGGGDASGCCPFQETIDLLSRRHAMTIIWLLQQAEPRRFNEIKRAVDINPVTLTQRLNELEEAGILHRQTFNEAPPRVEYSLTAKGRDLVPLMDQLSNWARKHQGAEGLAASRPPRPTRPVPAPV